MSTEKEEQQVNTQEEPVSEGIGPELNSEAIQNLAGFFDVLIQMDLEHKRNEREAYEHRRIAGTTSDFPTGTVPKNAFRSDQARDGFSKGQKK